MAEAPFEIPGHRWDPEKKRFFKILPGPSTSAPGSSSGAAGSGSTHRKSKQPKVENQKNEPPRPPLPALPSVASGANRSAFGQREWDPVAQRQQARSSVTAARPREHHLVQAAYSQLALTRVFRPFGIFPRPGSIACMSIGPWSNTLLVSNTNSDLLVVSRNWCCCMIRGSEDAGPNHVWPTSSRNFYAAFDGGALTSAVQITAPDASTLRHGMLQTEKHVFKVPIAIQLHGPASWATCCLSQPYEASEHSSVLAVASGRKVHVLILGHTHSTSRVQDVASATQPSDIMALALEPTGRVLYAGLRSGVVTAWTFTSNALTAARTVVAGQGSVTNLATPSSSELLVVRITGEISLVTPTGDTIRTFDGHVNSYRFDLGFALDNEFRVMALAGLDGRVRVWSLDLPTPIKASAAKVSIAKVGWTMDDMDTTEFKQMHQEDEGRVMEREDALETCVFPWDVTALLWQARMTSEDDAEEVGALKDLYVGAGQWVYHFTWP